MVRFRFAMLAAASLISLASNAQTECISYVETDAHSAFDIASLIRDAGSARAALKTLRRDAAKVNAGGGCAIFRDRRACEETLTLANLAINELEACTGPGVAGDNRTGRFRPGGVSGTTPFWGIK